MPQGQPKAKRNAWRNIKRPKVNPADYDVDGCIALVGAIVKQAVSDATARHGVQHPVEIDANRFLFEPGALENFFKRYNLHNWIDCDYIRRTAKDIIRGQIDISTLAINGRETRDINNTNQEDDDNVQSYSN